MSCGLVHSTIYLTARRLVGACLACQGPLTWPESQRALAKQMKYSHGMKLNGGAATRLAYWNPGVKRNKWPRINDLRTRASRSPLVWTTRQADHLYTPPPCPLRGVRDEEKIFGASLGRMSTFVTGAKKPLKDASEPSNQPFGCPWVDFGKIFGWRRLAIENPRSLPLKYPLFPCI